MKGNILLLWLILLAVNLFAQRSEYTFTAQSILPPPVNAASINKGGDVNVNLSSGTPNVSIPLAEVKSRMLGLAVTLNYASNGIKVNELASDVGLGWSLGCGGTITRTTLGLPDEERGSYNTDFTNFTKTSFNVFDRATMNYLQYKRDRESDVFDFSVNGYIQGKFILDQDLKPKLLNEKNYKISMISAKIFDGFRIIDDKGTVFSFTVADTSTYEGGDCADKTERTKKMVNSWHLTSIIKPYQDTIQFKYVDDNYSYLADINETESVCITSGIGGCAGSTSSATCPRFSGDYQRCFTFQTVEGKKVSEIVFNNGRLLFGYTPGRKDLDGGNALSSISLVNADDTIKHVTFTQDCPRYNKGVNLVTSDTSLRYRLMLRGLLISDSKAGAPVQRYSFSYLDEDQLPCRMSTGQDFFGFPNGKRGQYLLTSLEDEFPTLGYYGLGYPRRYGDRSMDTAYMRVGLLNKVVYPTGGSDSLVYDYNRKLEEYYVYHYKDAGFDQCPITTAGRTDSMEVNITFNQIVNISLTVTPRDPSYEGHDELIFTLKRTSGNQTVYQARVNLGQENGGEFLKDLELTPGIYKIIQKTEGTYICGYSTFRYQEKPRDTLFRDAPLGGVSISKVISRDNVANNVMTKSYSYKFRRNGEHATFPIVEDLRYVHMNIVTRFINCTDSYDCAGLSFCTYLVHSNTMVQPESMIGGRFFYHNSVIETTTGKDSIDRSVAHEFFFNQTFYGGVENGSPIPNTPYGIYSDMLIGDTATYYYSYNRSTKKTTNYRKVVTKYSTMRSRIVDNFKVVRVYESPCISNPVSTVEINSYNINSYPIFYQRSQVVATYDTLYAEDGSRFFANNTTSSYTGDPFSMPRRTMSVNSKGQQQTQYFRYFFDDAGSAIYSPLLSQNKIVPIEVTDSVNNKFTRKNIVSYRFTDATNRIIEPYKYEERIVPTEISDVTEKTRFDALGNVLEAKGEEQLTSFIWDYNNANLVASANNAAFQHVAYTSFESDGSGNWNIPLAVRDLTTAITGKKSFNLTGMAAITRTGLDSTMQYILSYWTRNSVSYTVAGTQGTPVKGKTYNGWTYFEHKLKGIKSVAVSGTNNIDELRLYPADAQMTTYTYLPLIGVSSQCDEKSQISYYEYDSLGRLRLAKDQDGKIIRMYDYQYQKPITQ